jgi:group I intron endonuclease
MKTTDLLQNINYLDKPTKGTKISGIYAIYCVGNNKFYIGSSKNIYRRWVVHREKLRLKRHSNIYLQNAWDKYGEDFFLFLFIRQSENYEAEEYSLLGTIIDKENLFNFIFKKSEGNKFNNKKHREFLKIERARLKRPRYLAAALGPQKSKMVLNEDKVINFFLDYVEELNSREKINKSNVSYCFRTALIEEYRIKPSFYTDIVRFKNWAWLTLQFFELIESSKLKNKINNIYPNLFCLE